VREAVRLLQIAFPPANVRAMSFRLLCLAIASLALPLPTRAMSQKPAITVRFHSEANPNDGEAFATPVKLLYQNRQIYLSRVPDISEKQIAKILPFPAQDGTWGCVFKLNPQGRLRLETMSGEIRGSTLVVFIATKTGHHQVADMIIDRPVTDGIISIPRGLTTLEVLAMKKQFKVLGVEEKKGWRERPREKTELPGPPGNRTPERASVNEPISTAMPSRRRGSAEPDLPRLSD
jgi:hypothetical protein